MNKMYAVITVILRVLSYVLIIPLLVGGAWMADWGVSYDAAQNIVSVNIETALATAGASIAIALGVLRRWGKW